MALEDVVQNVKVNVEVDGVDDSSEKLGGLQKQIAALGDAADQARGGTGGGGKGIDGLQDAFKNIGVTAADSFSKILSGVTSGNLTGLATLMGGPVAGSFTAAAEQLSAFIEQQDAAILKTASMAKQFGSTPTEIQGMTTALGEAGVSSQGFERLVNRMSQRVATDYSSMMKNIRTDSDTALGAQLRLQKANEALAESYGVPKEAFAAQDKYIAQQEAQIAKDQAIEQIREQALKSIPNITEKLREGIKTGHEAADVAETDINTLVKSIENMSRVGEGPASPKEVLKNIAEAIKTGAIDGTKAIALLKQEMGSLRAGGLTGSDPQKIIEFFKNDGWKKMEEATEKIKQNGLGLTKEDVKNAADATAQGEKLGEVWKALQEKFAAGLAPKKGALEEGLTGFLEKVPAVLQAISQQVDKMKGDKSKSLWENLFGALPEGWQKAIHAAEAKDKERFEKNARTGVGVSGEEPTTAATAPGAGPAGTTPIRVVRFGEYAPPGGTTETYNVKREQTSGTASILHLPEGGAPPPPEEAPGTKHERISVLDDANAPWRRYAALPPEERAAAMARDRAAAAPAAAPSPPPTGFPAPGAGTPTGFPQIDAGPITSAMQQAGATISSSAAPIGSAFSDAAGTVRSGGGGIAAALAEVGAAIKGAIAGLTGGPAAAPSAAPTPSGGPAAAPSAAPTPSSTEPTAPATIATAPSGAWSGGFIPGYEDGGGIGGFVKDQAQGYLTGKIMTGVANAGLKTIGVVAKGAVGTVAGVLSNPLNTGLLDATTVAAASRKPGSTREEREAKKYGATNLRDYQERRLRAMQGGMWGGGFIPEFAIGGAAIEIPKSGPGSTKGALQQLYSNLQSKYGEKNQVGTGGLVQTPWGLMPAYAAAEMKFSGYKADGGEIPGFADGGDPGDGSAEIVKKSYIAAGSPAPGTPEYDTWYSGFGPGSRLASLKASGYWSGGLIPGFADGGGGGGDTLSQFLPAGDFQKEQQKSEAQNRAENDAYEKKQQELHGTAAQQISGAGGSVDRQQRANALRQGKLEKAQEKWKEQLEAKRRALRDALDKAVHANQQFQSHHSAMYISEHGNPQAKKVQQIEAELRKLDEEEKQGGPVAAQARAEQQAQEEKRFVETGQWWGGGLIPGFADGGDTPIKLEPGQAYGGAYKTPTQLGTGVPVGGLKLQPGQAFGGLYKTPTQLGTGAPDHKLAVGDQFGGGSRATPQWNYATRSFHTSGEEAKHPTAEYQGQASGQWGQFGQPQSAKDMAHRLKYSGEYDERGSPTAAAMASRDKRMDREANRRRAEWESQGMGYGSASRSDFGTNYWLAPDGSHKQWRDPILGFMFGGYVPGFAGGGGHVSGPGTSTSDSILARLSAGEFVVKAAAVRAYGGGFMHAINNMQLSPPKFAMGGMVPMSSIPRFQAGGAIEPPHSILNLHIGDAEFKGLKAPDMVAQQLKSYALDQATASTGRKPSWVG